MIPTVERILFLHKIPLFQDFSVDELWQVAQALDEMEYSAGETLFEEGRPAHALYLIATGDATVSISGKDLAVIGKESVTGDVAVLDGMPYAVTVTANNDVVAIKIERDKLDDILDANPGAARGVIRILCQKLRYFGERVIEAHKEGVMGTEDGELPEIKL